MRRILLGLLVLAAAAATLVLTRGGSALERAAATCPKGYASLHDVQARERGDDEGEREVDERTARSLCIPGGARPETFKDLAQRDSQLNAVRSAPFARTPRGAYRAAYRQRERIRTSARAAAVPGAGGTWEPVGTGPLISNDPAYPNTSGQGIPTDAGRINDFAYDEAHGVVYAAVASGGVWRSADRGATWTSIGDRLMTQTVGSVAYSPADGGTVLVVTGDQNNGGNSDAGAGVYRTTDEGRTWEHASGVPDGFLGFSMRVDPTDPDVSYAATGAGLYRSADDGRTFTNVDLPTGDCHGDSTKKGCFLANIVSDVVVQSPDGFGHKGGKVIAAVGWRAGPHPGRDGKPQSPGNGLYASDSGAPGSFKKLAADGFTPQNRIGRVELGAVTGPKQDHDYLYAEVQDAERFNGGAPVIDVPEDLKQVPNTTVFDGVYVSKDFGRTWTQMTTAEELQRPGTGSALAPAGSVPLLVNYSPGIQAWYNEWVRVDPTRATADGAPERLAFGLEEIWQNDDTNAAADGKASFHVIGRYYTGETCQLGLVPTLPGVVGCPTDTPPAKTTTHPDQHGALWLPDGQGGVTLLSGNDGGAYAAHAGPGEEIDNTKWGNGSNEGLHTLLPYDVAIAKDGTVTAGLQDNGQLKITPEGKQFQVFGGDAFFSAIDPDDSKVIYEEYTGGLMNVSVDGGKTWRNVSPEVTSGLFSTPFVMDPTDAKHIVAGGRDIAETFSGPETSSADQTSVADTPLTSKGYDPSAPQWDYPFDLGTTADGADNQTSALDVRGKTVYAGYCGVCDVIGGGEFASGIATNASGTWKFAKAEGLPERYVTDVAIDPSDPKTVYATLGGYGRRWLPPGKLGEDASKVGSGHVFKSTDAGEHFTDVSGNLPDATADSVLVHDGNLVVGTDVGVFGSQGTDGGTYALLGGDSLPAAAVLSLKLAPNDPDLLYAASFGRGVQRYRFKDAAGGVASACQDGIRPHSRIRRHKTKASRHGGLRLRGTAGDRGCRGLKRKVRRVKVSVAERAGHHRCRYLRRNGMLGPARSCKRAHYLRAKGRNRWRLTLRTALPAGRYVARSRAIDRAGNRERRRGRRHTDRFRVR